MISRTLKRPMFRMGGSTNEGITSGLDAPRQNYSTAGQVLPYNMADLVKQSQTQAMDPAVRAAYQPYFERPEGEGLSRFLINFGLNLASTPPMGKGFSGLVSTAASAAKQPTAELFKDLDEQRLSKKAAEADLFKTLLEGNIDIAESAAEGSGETIAKKGVKLQIADNIEDTMDIIFTLENKKTNTPDKFTAEDALLLDKKKLRLEQLTKSDEVRSSLLGDSEYTQRILRKIKSNLIDKKNPDGSPMYPGGDDDTKLLEDMNRFYMEFFRTGKFPDFQELADGGRAGYMIGGGVGGGKDMGANKVTETATTPEPQKIDFDTLRARLPKEIGDDIVRLITASPEALEDFATIATQQDVDMFNQKYNVNLVLPQEA